MMKKYIYSILMLFVTFSFVGCSNDDIDDNTIFPTDPVSRNELDTWILNNYTYPYNVQFKYKWEDKEADLSYQLVPADSAKSAKLAKMVKYMWFDVYDELVGQDFLKQYVPKTIVLIGSVAYNSNGTYVMGTATGGVIVTLYGVNGLTDDVLKDYSQMNDFYFHTMHHEFTHILNQTVYYNTDFDYVSEGKYVKSNWYQYDDSEARQMGFVSAYAMDEGKEDFAEMLSLYVTSSETEWADILIEAGSEGAAIINTKLNYVRDYMDSTWGIKIDELRKSIQRRGQDMSELDLNTLN